MASYLAPKLSNSNLAYRDLFFNPATNKVGVPAVQQKMDEGSNYAVLPLLGIIETSYMETSLF